MDAPSVPPIPKRVLVIDDEPSILALVGLYLEKEGYSLTFACNGFEGLRCFEKSLFDVVISDRVMPEMTGDEFAEAVRSLAPQVPIILISGHSGPAVDTTHFDAFLPKPFTRTQLIEAVNDALLAA